MVKTARYALIFLFALTAAVCISLFVACQRKDSSDGLVKISGSIVFESDENDEFTRDITLSFTPENGSADGASAAVTYSNSAGKTATAAGFTIDETDGKYFLCAGDETRYDLDLKWSPDNASENSVTLHGEFIVTDIIDDYENHSEGARHYADVGYFGAGAVAVSGEVWFFNFEDFKISDSEYLKFYINPHGYSAGILEKDDKDILMKGDPNLRNLHWMKYKLADGSAYGIYDFLIFNGSTEYLLVYKADYFASDCKECSFEFDGEETILKFGECIYSSAACDEEVGSESYLCLENSGFQLPDGTPAYTCFPAINCESGKDGDWLLYDYWQMERSIVSCYFEFDQDGNVIHESVNQVERDVCVNGDYAADYVYYYDSAKEKYLAWRLLYFGTIENSELQPMDATIKKVGDTTFDVSAGGQECLVAIDIKDCLGSGGEYLTSSITITSVLADVSYSNADNWAYSETDTAGKQADVFFVAPSVATGGAGREIYNYNYKASSKTTFKAAIDMEKDIYDDNARFFAPYYRQAVLYAYGLEDVFREDYLAFAYSDVKAAFEYYLEHDNNDRPIVLAGFSQGADHCIRLLKDFSAEISDRLVACYAIGWRITAEELEESGLVFASGERDTGVIISFNCEAEDVDQSIIVPKDCKTLAINPLNWKTDGTAADKSLDMGACFYDAETGLLIEEKPNLTGAYIDDVRGTLKVPDIDADEYNNNLGGFVGRGVYHFYDYQFFYRNLEDNVQNRIEAFAA